METLGQHILDDTRVLATMLRQMDHPQPSFSINGPTQVLPLGAPEAARKARTAILESCYKLYQLVAGPSDLLPNLQASYQTLFALQWLMEFDILANVPLEGSSSYAQVAKAAKVPESQLISIARMAMTSHILCEPQAGQLSHSAASSMFLRNPEMLGWARFMFRASIPTAASTVEATRRWPGSQDKTETAYNAAFNHRLSFFEHLSQNTDLHREFSGYMKCVAGGEGTDLKHLMHGFDWAGLPDDSLVVDIGGSTGHASSALAEAYPQLRFQVQDREEVITTGLRKLETFPASIKERVTFHAHNFFTPQPTKGARVYLLRMIIHDWNDLDARNILSHVAEAMSMDSMLLIMDTILPGPGEIPSILERIVRVRDLTMRQVFNSKERTLDDWRQLIATTDKKLSIMNVEQPQGSHMSLLSVFSKGDV